MISATMLERSQSLAAPDCAATLFLPRGIKHIHLTFPLSVTECQTSVDCEPNPIVIKMISTVQIRLRLRYSPALLHPYHVINNVPV